MSFEKWFAKNRNCKLLEPIYEKSPNSIYNYSKAIWKAAEKETEMDVISNFYWHPKHKQIMRKGSK